MVVERGVKRMSAKKGEKKKRKNGSNNRTKRTNGIQLGIQNISLVNPMSNAKTILRQKTFAQNVRKKKNKADAKTHKLSQMFAFSLYV